MRDLASPGRSRTIPPAVGVLLCRPPAAFPCLRVALPRAKPNHPPRSRGPCLSAACGGLCRPEVGVPLPARRSAPGEAEPSPSQSGSLSVGRLRRPVPTGGRRSLARASLCPGRSRTIPLAVGVLVCRPPAAACADRRSAFPCLRVALPRPKPNHPLRSRGPCLPAARGGLCRPEVGVPVPARRSAPGEAEPSPSQLGSLSAGRLRRPVPTRGRRSRARASLCSGRSRTIPPALGSFSAGRLRRPVPTRGRRSLACASLCPGRSRTIPLAVGVLVCRPPAAACADQRSAFPCLRVALPRAKPNHPPRSRGPCLPAACGGLCRPEVGVPLPARRSAPGEAEPSPSAKNNGSELCSLPA